jgi:hypothetical protein
VATSEKQSDILEAFTASRVFRDRFQLKLPEKKDREAIIQWLLEYDPKLKGI